MDHRATLTETSRLTPFLSPGETYGCSGEAEPQPQPWNEQAPGGTRPAVERLGLAPILATLTLFEVGVECR